MWNKWLIIELVIISRNEVKKTVEFKTCGPDSALLFRRRTVYSSLHIPLWPKNCLNSVYKCSLICDKHIDTQYSRFLYGRQDTKPLKERYPLNYSI